MVTRRSKSGLAAAFVTACLSTTALTPAYAQEAPSAQAGLRDFAIDAQPLMTALLEFSRQTNAPVVAPAGLTEGRQAPAVQGRMAEPAALAMLLDGSGLRAVRGPSGGWAVTVTQGPQGASAGGDVDALIVTAQKREEDIQDVPIAISAFSQEDLTRSQIAGGPDLMTQVPNMTFTKTNFTGYSIQIRGIGTQAVSATTDAAVAVAFNNTPFIRNRFFEQEFYDLQRVEVLRGPQGTLYGRNATAGVVNLISQKPKFVYEAKLSADVSNYSSARLEGMLNIPLVEDKVALRIAGAWTKRDGFVTNAITDSQIDGRDLWSTRTTLRVAPTDRFEANLIWEHFQENDDRLRSGKQLCNQDNRFPYTPGASYSDVLSQGCLPASLYSPDSYQAPNGYSLPYYLPLKELGVPVVPGFNPYASLVQSPDLRVIESTVDPKYTAKSDLAELQWNLEIGHGLSLASETSYNYDTIFSSEDYNRFNTASGAFLEAISSTTARLDFMQPGPNGFVFCDPQIGCADRVVAVDASRAKSSQFSQEFRLSSDYDGPLNFSLGANFLRYDTEDKYYVFINTLTIASILGQFDVLGPLSPWNPGVTDNQECMNRGMLPPDPNAAATFHGCIPVDPNPIESVNDLGHNYFLSRNPYKLISYAAFGELYYNITNSLKLTAGLRWTVDKKEAPRIPSWLLGGGSTGLSVMAVEDQEWREPTGRLTLDWKPDLSFTEETMVYGSFAHGYKAGGSNPPPSGVLVHAIPGAGGFHVPEGDILVAQSVTKPKTFDPEFVNAFELGAKSTLLDGNLTLNLSTFYYDYTGYQVSQIIDRSAVNYNFDAKIWGAEVEADWRPLENLRLGLKGGYEHTRIADGERAIDIIDRTAGRTDWLVVRPFPTFPSNCVLPKYVMDLNPPFNGGNMGPCENAYVFGRDPISGLPYKPNPYQDLPGTIYTSYPGYDPNKDVGQNHGEGFFKELGGKELPNAPHFTATITADYTLPLPSDWLMTLHTDLYYQSEAWTRVFNTEGYDRLKAYNNINVAAIFTNDDAGWKVMAYVKNVLDRDSITGAFLNSDDTGLTTNVFLTEPRLYGVRVTKDFDGGPWWTGANPDHKGPYPFTVELGGAVLRQDAPYATLAPDFVQAFSDALDPTKAQHRDLDWGDGREVRLTYRTPSSPFRVTAGVRYGKSNKDVTRIHSTEAAGPGRCIADPNGPFASVCYDPEDPYFNPYYLTTGENWSDSSAQDREEHHFADFAVGWDVGLGILSGGKSTVGLGLRYAQFKSNTWATLDGVPNIDVPDAWQKYDMTFDHYRSSINAERKFEGLGPALSWEAAKPLIGNEAVGHVDLDWSITGGALFGKQTTAVTGTQGSSHESLRYFNLLVASLVSPTATPLGIPARGKSVTAPFVDLSVGLSYEIQRIKLSTGYRWERYFDVLDAGYAGHKGYDRTIDGPYFKIAVGFGG